MGVISSGIYPNLRLKWPEYSRKKATIIELRRDSTNMDLLWAWITAMQKNGDNGFIPFRLNPPMDEEAALRNEDPGIFAAAFHTGHDFKNGVDEEGNEIYGMDYYINDRLDGDVLAVKPNGEKVSLEQRHDDVRAEDMFEYRGRVSVDDLPDPEYQNLLLSREDSIENYDAGIARHDDVPDEAQDFFDVPVVHGGKNFNVRTGNDWNTSALFESIGAPFIAGPSGSIEYLILSMEDDCNGACPDGMVPRQFHHVREALIGLMTAILVAGGHHSVTECVAVAQAMGYFSKVPDILHDYKAGLKAFSSYLVKLGVAPLPPAPRHPPKPIQIPPPPPLPSPLHDHGPPPYPPPRPASKML